MDDSNQEHLLEIYKLHADLADRVSQRRDGANRLHITLQVGLVMFLAALLRFGPGATPEYLLWGGAGIVGLLQAVVWYVTIRSYRQLNSSKFRVLTELERQLSFQFFRKEWDPKNENRQSNRYWTLTNVERSIPAIFALLWLAIIGYALCLWLCR